MRLLDRGGREVKICWQWTPVEILYRILVRTDIFKTLFSRDVKPLGLDGLLTRDVSRENIARFHAN